MVGENGSVSVICSTVDPKMLEMPVFIFVLLVAAKADLAAADNDVAAPARFPGGPRQTLRVTCGGIWRVMDFCSVENHRQHEAFCRTFLVAKNGE